MAEDFLGVLTRFHREIVVPDIERIVERALDGRLVPLREEMLANFDAIFKALERLESEYQSLSGAVRRIEEGMGSMQQKIERLALRSELVELKERVQALEQRITQLEAQLQPESDARFSLTNSRFHEDRPLRLRSALRAADEMRRNAWVTLTHTERPRCHHERACARPGRVIAEPIPAYPGLLNITNAG